MGELSVPGGRRIGGMPWQLPDDLKFFKRTTLTGPAEGDAFMPVFEEAFPVMEVIEVQAGVAEWRRYRRG